MSQVRVLWAVQGSLPVCEVSDLFWVQCAECKVSGAVAMMYFRNWGLSSPEGLCRGWHI